MAHQSQEDAERWAARLMDPVPGQKPGAESDELAQLEGLL